VANVAQIGRLIDLLVDAVLREVRDEKGKRQEFERVEVAGPFGAVIATQSKTSPKQGRGKS